MSKDRLYDLSEDIKDPELLKLAQSIGVSAKLAGLVFVMGSTEHIVYLDEWGDKALHDVPSTKGHFPNTAEMAAILRQSDNPVIYRDHKPWQRKAQYQISGQVQQKIWARDGFRCMVTGRKMGDVTLSVDHWIPLELGGGQ